MISYSILGLYVHSEPLSNETTTYDDMANVQYNLLFQTISITESTIFFICRKTW